MREFLQKFGINENGGTTDFILLDSHFAAAISVQHLCRTTAFYDGKLNFGARE